MKRITIPQQAAQDFRQHQTRRWFFKDCAVGLGALALGQLFDSNGNAAPLGENPLA